MPPPATGLPNSSRTAVAVEEIGFQAARKPSQSGIRDGETKVLEIIVTGKATAYSPPAASGVGTSMPSQTPTQIRLNRSSRSSPNPPRAAGTPPSARQPISSAVAARMASSAAATTRSAVPRPAAKAEGAIGMDRKRSTTPLEASVTTATAVFMKPIAMVIANMPGIRNSR